VGEAASGTADLDLRKALLSFTADFANWDNSAMPVYLRCARGLVRAADAEEPPLVVDPFAGGGSIPPEALRIGRDAYASDLNPAALRDSQIAPRRYPTSGTRAAEELRRVAWVNRLNNCLRTMFMKMPKSCRRARKNVEI
jgi:putative DNA methylase